LNRCYQDVVRDIKDCIRNLSSHEHLPLISEIIAAQLPIPWSKSRISEKFGDRDLICKEIKKNKKLILWSTKNFLFGLLLLANMISILFSKHKKMEPICLVYSLTSSQLVFGKSALREFLMEPRLGLNNIGEQKILVETNYKNQKEDHNHKVEYSKNLALYYFEEYLSPCSRSRLLLSILRRSVQSLLERNFLEFLFMRQTIIEHEIGLEIVKNFDSIDVITTQSNLRRLPTVFYSEVHNSLTRSMVWYSNNSNVIEKQSNTGDFDMCRHKRENIDFHFVWGKSWQSELSELNPSARIKEVGSLMMYPRNFKSRNLEAKRILAFDVTPIENFIDYTFYSSEMILGFLGDIASCVEAMNVKLPSSESLVLSVKQKRKQEKKLETDFSRAYQRVVLEKQVNLIDPEENLYAILAESRIAIGIPYVSPIFIARELGLPCCYYISRQFEDWELLDELDGVKVIRGLEHLQDWISAELR
jgi:polysaccharide biosynthesis PFTS motif protein